MKLPMIKTIYAIAAILTLVTASCAIESLPPDCTKPAKPTITPDLTVNEGGSFKLQASGVKDGLYSWSGPNGFHSDSASTHVNNANINNSGKYWAKVRVGYCYSDSVATNVVVKTDSTCSLNDNVANFPNGPQGAFSLTTSCGNGGNYTLTAANADTSILLDIRFKQKPTSGGAYTLTDSPNPAPNEVYYKMTTALGRTFFAKGNNAFVKVKNGKVNIVLCSCLFPDAGVFSANVACM